MARLMTEPVPAAELEARARAAARPALRWLIVLVPIALIAGIAYMAYDMWSQIPPDIAPRHRAEALCFALAMADPVTHERFSPPMRIEPSAALVQGRFAPGIAAPIALRQVMQIDESMVMSETQRTVGDYDVSVLWLRLPADPGGEGSGVGRHWLVLAWMEGADLAVCNFRFSGMGHELTPDERLWGDRLIERLLVPANFTAGSLPHVRLRATRDATMPVLGPAAR
jgi:hypothetical protein